MLPRGLEVLLVSLLLVVTVGTVFQFMNYQTQAANQHILRQTLTELRDTRQQLADAIASQPTGAPAPRPIPAARLTPATPAAHPHRPAAPEVADAEPEKHAAPPDTSNSAAGHHPTAPASATPVAEKPQPPQPPSPPVEDPAAKGWQTYGPTVTNVIENLLAGHYDAVVKRFNDSMSAELSPAQLAAVIDPVRKAHGPMKELTRHAPLQGRLPANMHAFEVTTELTDGHKLLFTVTLDDQQRVSGLLMK